MSAGLVAAKKEHQEKERQRKEQLQQQHNIQAALAQRQKVSVLYVIYNTVYIQCTGIKATAS